MNYGGHANFERSNIIVFFDNKDGAGLYCVDGEDLRLVKRYGEVNSVSGNVMSNVLDDVCKMFPARENGIVFWSHGSGWLPTGATRSFGYDGGEAMDISVLATVFCLKYDYIIFDACYMGCIEVLAEVYPYCKYFMASPGVVPSSGIITPLSLSVILGEGSVEERLSEVCNIYSSVYPDVAENTAPISFFRASLTDDVIFACKNMLFDIGSVKQDEIYKYGFRANDIFYDFGSFISSASMCGYLPDGFMVFSSHAEQIKGCMGISVFIPTESNKDYQEVYSVTKWNVLTGWLDKF